MSLPEQIAALPEPDRRALLARLLEKRTRRAEYPATPAQRALWLWEKLDPAAAAYNVPIALHLSGALNATALEHALSEVIQRHEALRTTFAERNGDLVQVVTPAAPFALSTINLAHLSPDAREVEARRIEAEIARLSFDVAREVPLRMRLLRLSEHEHRLLFTAHHIIFDGWSIGILLRELSTLYGAFAADLPSSLPAPALQYGEFAVLQRERLNIGFKDGVAHWLRRVEGAPGVLELPTDHPRPAAQTFRGARHAFHIPVALADAVRSLARDEGGTSYSVFLAAFKALLLRYTGQTDLVVGSPSANRTSVETEGVIGFFANTLILRTDFSGNPTFRVVLARVREGLRGALAEQELPFDALVERLAVPRSRSHTPLFQVAFAMLDPPGAGVDFPGLETELTALDNGGAKFDLALVLAPGRHGIKGWIEYATDLFDAARIERMADHLEMLLQTVSLNPERRLSELPLLTDAEREVILVRWGVSGTKDPAATVGYIHRLFEAEACANPDSIALVFRGERVTYGELEGRSNQLAQRLRRLGVGPEVRVGICAERSLELVVGLLGILKAGGAYVPIDPAYPAERVAFMLSDAAVPVLLAQERLLEGLPEHRAEVVLLDAHWADIAQESEADPRVKVDPENVAYVIYTSGSTGRPKGTEVPHRALTGFFWGVDYARFDARETLFQHSSTSWDALTLELWPALATGGCCVLHEDDAAGPKDFAAAICERGVTTLWLSAAHFNAILDAAPNALRGVRQLLVGGEAVSATHIRRALEELPGTRIVNGYGPSECTVFTTCHRIEHLQLDAAAVPIGRPVGDRRVYLLDCYGNPVPIGITGELYVGGPAVPRGYLARPALTAARLVPDPFSEETGSRLYRSGDLARWRADGVLEFVARTDDQVKVRGFRIELGEIEAVLTRHPTVRDATVVVREDLPGEKRLVAYVVGTEDCVLDFGALRDALLATLPEYMVPASFVVLNALPLTPHGKVDRRALPAPAGDEDYPFTAPRNAVESLVARVWAEVLGSERVGVHDDFFLLGGHSLLALRVTARMQELFGVQVSLRALFEAPTVASLAGVLEGLVDSVQLQRIASLHTLIEGLSEEELEAALANGTEIGMER